MYVYNSRAHRGDAAADRSETFCQNLTYYVYSRERKGTGRAAAHNAGLRII